MNVVSKGQEFFKNILDKLDLKKKAIAFCVENWGQLKSWVKYSLSLKKNGSNEVKEPATIGDLIKNKMPKSEPEEERLDFPDAQEEAIKMKSEKDAPDPH